MILNVFKDKKNSFSKCVELIDSFTLLEYRIRMNGNTLLDGIKTRPEF